MYLPSAKSSRLRPLYFLSIAIVCLLSAAFVARPALAVSSKFATMIGATVCYKSPPLTITSPASGTTITSSSFEIQGTVDQTAQIEVNVDGLFDSFILINMGQHSFASTIELPLGTHKIELTAINNCSSQNTTKSITITRENAFQVPSTGTGTQQLGVTTARPNGTQGQGGSPMPDLFYGLSQWLNIDYSGRRDDISRMTVNQTVLFTFGLMAVFFGGSTRVVRRVARLRLLAGLWSDYKPSLRLRLLGWVIRLSGLALIIATILA